VALECQQVEGENFIETYSPTIQVENLRLTIAIVSKYDLKLKQLNIKAAYFNADLEEDTLYKNSI